MKKKITPFRFKQFEVAHSRSAMRVGVDGVLVGCWCSVSEGVRILDVGCGCGLISLILAQRSPESEITGIDIDPESIAEASANFRCSPWSERLTATLKDASSLRAGEEQYDLIVSNPPFFSSGVLPETRRETARHQSSLSPESLLDIALNCLKEGGRLAMIIPCNQASDLIIKAEEHGLKPMRITEVYGRQGGTPKRTLIELIKKPLSNQAIEKSLTILDKDGNYTDQYMGLTGDFYLNF